MRGLERNVHQIGANSRGHALTDYPLSLASPRRVQGNPEYHNHPLNRNLPTLGKAPLPDYGEHCMHYACSSQ